MVTFKVTMTADKMAFVWRSVDFDVLEGSNHMWTMDDFDVTSPNVKR